MTELGEKLGLLHGSSSGYIHPIQTVALKAYPARSLILLGPGIKALLNVNRSFSARMTAKFCRKERFSIF